MVALRTAAAAVRVPAGRVAASFPRSAAASLVHARSVPAAASLRPWHPGPGPLVGAKCFCAGRGWALQPGHPAGKRSLSTGGAEKDEKSSQEAQGEGAQEEGGVKKEILERALEHVHTWGWTTQVRKRTSSRMGQPECFSYIPPGLQLPLSATTQLYFFAKPQPGHEAPALASWLQPNLKAQTPPPKGVGDGGDRHGALPVFPRALSTRPDRAGEPLPTPSSQPRDAE